MQILKDISDYRKLLQTFIKFEYYVVVGAIFSNVHYSPVAYIWAEIQDAPDSCPPTNLFSLPLVSIYTYVHTCVRRRRNRRSCKTKKTTELLNQHISGCPWIIYMDACPQEILNESSERELNKSVKELFHLQFWFLKSCPCSSFCESCGKHDMLLSHIHGGGCKGNIDKHAFEIRI